MRNAGAFLVFVVLVVAPGIVHATTYQVGPGRLYTTLQAVAGFLNPGDLVEVDGDVTYPGGVVFSRPGNLEQPITIHGLRVNGNRPIISGATNTVTFATPDVDDPANGANHYVFEGFELTGGSFRCLYHQADDLIARDLLVHDCPAHGILGADQGSGSLLLERVEVHHCGNGTSQHQIYVATDEVHHPGSIFRMQHCYLHDGNGGNNVKSRAERNEIYYNWIEGALYHELELIGPDPYGAPDGWTEDMAREDSDVVGNVLWKSNTFYVTRVGGDGTGQSKGRYRFVNNTVLAGTSAVFRVFDGIQSIEMHNNVFCRSDGTALNVIRTVDAVWTDGEQIAGSSNWVRSGSSNIPVQWADTLTGTDPAFTDLASFDLGPAAGSPLLNAANPAPSTPAGFPFPSPMFPPDMRPPRHTVESAPAARAFDCDLDIGALERPAAVPVVWGLRCAGIAGDITWNAVPDATAYDVVKGDLFLLLSTGHFSTSLIACLEDDGTDTAASDPAIPAQGNAFYYLVRSAGGTYDSACPSLIASRDSDIQSSPFACP
jgi:hypothetical protein